MEAYIKQENECLKTENQLLRESSWSANNILNGHQSNPEELNRSLQVLLEVLEKQRKLISSLESSLDETQSEYENLLEKSLQDARLNSVSPLGNNRIAELVVNEESLVNELQKTLRQKISESARELSEIQTISIRQNAEIMQTNFLPSKSPTLHKSGARLNEAKRDKYLAPLN